MDWLAKAETISKEFNSLIVASDKCIQCLANEIISHMVLLNIKLTKDQDTIIVFMCEECSSAKDSKKVLENIMELSNYGID